MTPNKALGLNMSRALKILGIGLLVLGVLILVGWAIFYPAVPQTPKGWLALIFLGVPFLIVCALVAQWFSVTDPLPNWPEPARLLFFAICACVTIVALVYLVSLVQS
jgi:hypothetical protein